MAHTPLGMTVPEVQAEIRHAWLNSYSGAATAHAIESIADEPVPYKISHLIARIFFRGIYFPPKGIWGWAKGGWAEPGLDFPDCEGILHEVERSAWQPERGAPGVRRPPSLSNPRTGCRRGEQAGSPRPSLV